MQSENTHIIILCQQGNHGEDCKELYYYLDSTPTHSYMKALYKYPQSEYPYAWLENENRNRGVEQSEFEIEDTGKLLIKHRKLLSLILMDAQLNL